MLLTDLFLLGGIAAGVQAAPRYLDPYGKLPKSSHYFVSSIGNFTLGNSTAHNCTGYNTTFAGNTSGNWTMTKLPGISNQNSSSYRLTSDYTSRNLEAEFDFVTGQDPSGGFTQYVDYAAANKSGLIKTIPHPKQVSQPDRPAMFTLGADSTQEAPKGRTSVRMESKKKFTHTLVIADIWHMPEPVCGTWPAYWLLGSGKPWPEAGEIDILEGVNEQSVGHYTMHTGKGATLLNGTIDVPQRAQLIHGGSAIPANVSNSAMTGVAEYLDCDTHSPDQPDKTGCRVRDFDGSPSYGKAFNTQGGGVFATLIDSSGVAIWFFDREHIPMDITMRNMTPTPPTVSGTSTWGLPNARFSNPAVKWDDHFQNMGIIVNTAFCGGWANSLWGSSDCAKLAPTCEEYVEKNPLAFANAFWAIDSIKMYEK